MIGESLGPYRIARELGSGGMGKVYEATVDGRVPGIDDGARVALKVMHPHLLETDGFFRRFMREADLGASIRHENVVATYLCDQLVVEGAHHSFIAMEYVEGQTLRELLTELDRVPEELCRHIGREVAKALTAIHGAGVVHRDLKPENVLITPDHQIKVMDLGVARLADEAIRLSLSGAFVGSLHYAAPEQLGGGLDVDHRVDLHALGLVLYELACGQQPFDHRDMRRVMGAVLHDAPRSVAEINPQLSPFFEEVVHKLVAKDRDARFQTAAELSDVLEAGEDSPWWKTHAAALRKETKQPLRRVHVPRETALYGRDDDLAELRRLYEKAQAGDGQVLFVEGEAGIGKTRLVDEFVGQLRQDGEDVNFLFGSYPPGGAATAAGGFSTAYREQFGSAGLTQVLETYLAETPVLISAFAALLRGEPSPKGEEPLTKDSLQTVFVHATRALAAERTTIVLIDDLHFAPEGGRALFTALSLALPGHRVLLVGTTRPGVLPEEYVTELDRTEHSSRMALHRLGPKDMVKLLENSLGSDRLAEELAGKIALKSDGNPFFVFEILRALREGQFIRQKDDGSWATTQVIEQIEIPSSVMDLIQARIADLSEDEKDLLDVAACCGYEFDPSLVAAVMGMGRIPALKRMGRIEKSHRLVRSAGRNYAFDHHQVQEALYAGLHEQMREEYHAAVAEALEAREQVADRDPGEIDGSLAVDLCEHFLKGARGERGLRYLEAALDHLESNYLNDFAIALADRALGVRDLVSGEERIDLLLRKAARLEHLGRREEQSRALTEASQVEDALPRPPNGRVTRSIGTFLKDTARFEEALVLLTRALEEAQKGGDTRLLADAATGLAWALFRVGRTEEARAHLERAIELYGACGETLGVARATGGLGSVLYQLGQFELAKDHYRRAIEVTRAMGTLADEATLTGNLGLVFKAQGHLPEARVHCERNLQLAREIGLRKGEGAATGNLGSINFAEGRLAEARGQCRRSLEINREVGNPRSEALLLGNLGSHLWLAGGETEARERLHAAISLARATGAKRELAGALLYLGSIQVAQGEEEAGRKRLDEALEIARGIGELYVVTEGLCALGALARERGDDDLAKELLGEALETAQRAGRPMMQIIVRAQLATLGVDVVAALALHEEHEDRMHMSGAMEARFLLFRATGDPAHLADAHRRLTFMRDHVGGKYETSILETVPLHRDIVAAWKEHGR